MDSFEMAPLSTAFLARLKGLPLELKVMILCYVAAQGVRQLQNIRSLSHFIDNTVLVHQYEIVPCALSNQGSPHYAADRFYRGLFQPANAGLQYLSNMTRHFQIARELSRALADKLVETHPSLRLLKRLDVASYDRFVRNVEPYILVLAHFLESYRDGLADFVPPDDFDRNKEPCDWVESSIVDGYNNEVTGHRLCSLYLMLKRILDWELDAGYQNHLLCSVFDQFDNDRFRFQDSLDIFIFGGIEAVKDIMAEPNSTRYPAIVRDHLARACPYDTWSSHAHGLPRSTLPTLDQTAVIKICLMLPEYPMSTVLDIYSRKYDPYYPMLGEEGELIRFYDYSRIYKGDKPSLF